MLKKVLVTGFCKFDIFDSNPTEKLVHYIADGRFTDSTFDIYTCVLSVEYRQCEKELDDLVISVNPDIVLSFGLGFNKEVLTIERIALNIDDGSFGNGGAEDNAHERRDGTPIIDGGPVGYFATIPVNTIRDTVLSHGISVKMSNDAGSFVCNHVFYYLSHLSSKMDKPFKVGFFHFPPLKEDVIRWGINLDGCTFSQIIDSFRLILNVLRRY